MSTTVNPNDPTKLVSVNAATGASLDPEYPPSESEKNTHDTTDKTAVRVKPVEDAPNKTPVGPS